MSSERAYLLGCMIRLEGDLEKVEHEIRKLPFDTDFPLVLISPDDITAIMKRYIEGRIDAEGIEEWAEFLESRDDVGFRPPFQSGMRRIIQKLANPALFGIVSDDMAQAIVKELEGYK